MLHDIYIHTRMNNKYAVSSPTLLHIRSDLAHDMAVTGY